MGTTDEACTKENATSPSAEEEAYLLNYVRDWFPQLQHPQVSSRWAGGRPLLKPADQAMDSSRVVREALLERSHWLTQAPFLARRLELALPTQQLWGQAYYRVGLGVYDALAGQRSIGHSRLLSQQQMRQALPLLKPCQGGVAYSCLLYTSPSPRDMRRSRMPSSA